MCLFSDVMSNIPSEPAHIDYARTSEAYDRIIKGLKKRLNKCVVKHEKVLITMGMVDYAIQYHKIIFINDFPKEYLYISFFRQ